MQRTYVRTARAPRRWWVHSCDRHWSITSWQHSLTPSPYANYPSDCPNKAHSSPCIRCLQCNTRMFWNHDVRTTQEIKATSRRSSSLLACPKRVNLKDTIIIQATYPISYSVLGITCPLIIRRRSIWISYDEDTSILSCCPINTALRLYYLVPTLRRTPSPLSLLSAPSPSLSA